MKKLILFLFLISGYLLHSQNKTFYGNITVKDVPTFAVTDSLLTIDSNGLFKYRPISTLPFGSGGGSELSFTYPLTETNDIISFDGSNYKQWSEVVTLGEDVAQGKIIVSHIDGKWYKASASDIGIGGNRLLVTYVAALTDEQVQANNALSLPCISCTYTAGDRLYLSETAGEFTTTAPTTGIVRLVGTVSPDTKGWFAEDVFYHVEPTFHSVKADGTEVDGIPLLGDIDLSTYAENVVLGDTVSKYQFVVLDANAGVWKQLVDTIYFGETEVIITNYTYGKALGLMLEDGLENDINKRILLKGHIEDDIFNFAYLSSLSVGSDGFPAYKSSQNHYPNSYLVCGIIKTANSFYFNGLDTDFESLHPLNEVVLVEDQLGSIQKGSSMTTINSFYNSYRWRKVIGKKTYNVVGTLNVGSSMLINHGILTGTVNLILDNSTLNTEYYFELPFSTGQGVFTITPESDTFLNGVQGVYSYSLKENTSYILKSFGVGNWYINRVFDETIKISTIPPETITSTGTKGQIIYTADYVYVCIDDNSWKRIAITTW